MHGCLAFFLLVRSFPPGFSLNVTLEKSPESFRDFSFELCEFGKISDGTVPTSDCLSGVKKDFFLHAALYAFVYVRVHARLPDLTWPRVLESGVKHTVSGTRRSVDRNCRGGSARRPWRPRDAGPHRRRDSSVPSIAGERIFTPSMRFPKRLPKCVLSPVTSTSHRARIAAASTGRSFSGSEESAAST